VDRTALPLGGTRRGQTSLDLSGLTIRAADLMVLAGFVGAVGAGAVAVRTITLAAGSVGRDVIAALAAVPTLARLEITGKMTDATMRTAGASLLACNASRLGSLKCEAFDLPNGGSEVDLARSKLGPPAATLLAGAMKFNGSLITLDLSRNELEAEAAKALAPALAFNGSLTSLNLSSNELGPAGAEALAPGLASNASLTCCNVLQNEMDVAAAESLVEAVKDKDVSLAGIKRDQTTANLRNRGLKPPDAMLLASDLSKAVVSASLTRLNVSYNSMRDEGVKLLRDAVSGRERFELIDHGNE